MLSAITLPNNPFPLSGHSATKIGNSIAIFGGENSPSSPKNYLFLLTQTEQWIQLNTENNPPPHTQHSSFSASLQLYVFGGFENEKLSNKLYSIDMSQVEDKKDGWSGKWKTVPCGGNVPRERFGHSTALVSSTKVLLIGGQGHQTSDEEIPIFGDQYLLDLETFEWKSCDFPGEKPSIRCFHSSTIIGSKLYVFGGFNGESYLNDIYELDIENRKWSQLQVDPDSRPPSPRASHSAIGINNNLLIAGGFSLEGYYKDFWIFNLETKIWKKCNNVLPTSRMNHTINQFGNKLVLLGGNTENETAKDAHFVIDPNTLIDKAIQLPPLDIDSSDDEELEETEEEVLDSKEGHYKSLYLKEQDSYKKLRKKYSDLESSCLGLKLKLDEMEEEQALAHRKDELIDVNLESISTRQRNLTLDLQNLFQQRGTLESQLEEIQKSISRIDKRIELKLYNLSSLMGLNKNSSGTNLPSPSTERQGGLPTAEKSLSSNALPLLPSSFNESFPKDKGSNKRQNSKTDLSSRKKKEEEKQKHLKKKNESSAKKEKKTHDKKSVKKKTKPKEKDVKADPANFAKAKFRLGDFLSKRQVDTRPQSSASVQWKPRLDKKIVKICCDYIDSQTEVVGIFRIPGFQTAVETIYNNFQNPDDVKIDESPHNMVGAFRLWLRSLETPIIPFETFDDAIGCVEKYRESGDIEIYKQYIKNLPQENREILQMLIKSLCNIAANSEVNKMDSLNVGIVFGPTLVRMNPDKETPEAILSTSQKGIDFVADLISKYNTIFEVK